MEEGHVRTVRFEEYQKLIEQRFDMAAKLADQQSKDTKQHLADVRKLLEDRISYLENQLRGLRGQLQGSSSELQVSHVQASYAGTQKLWFGIFDSTEMLCQVIAGVVGLAVGILIFFVL